jgi:hypothetical protein
MNIEFRFVPSIDPTVEDPNYEVFLNGEKTAFTVSRLY